MNKDKRLEEIMDIIDNSDILSVMVERYGPNYEELVKELSKYFLLNSEVEEILDRAVAEALTESLHDINKQMREVDSNYFFGLGVNGYSIHSHNDIG